MNDYLLSVLLGIVEGLTEFLPVSSTAHLRIAEQLLHIDLASGYWKMYSVVIQLGAILALPIYFRSRIAQFLATFPGGRRGDRTTLSHPLSLVLLAFLVTAAPSFLLSKVIGKNLESLTVIAMSLIIGGVIMWAVDWAYDPSRRNAPTQDMEQMSLGQSIGIGLAQVLAAVFPGTSRSMATIAAGQLSGMSRPAALEFSFFLSMPTMAAATLYALLKGLRGKTAESAFIAPANSHEWIVLAIGFVVSFVVAYAVVAWFMKYVQRHGFVPFAVYRIVAGVAVLFLR